MNAFKDFGIAPALKSFEGEKIKVHKILDKEIMVCAWKEDESKFKEKGSGRRLDIQIELDGEKRVVFTGSICLLDMIKRVPENKFPFKTIIVEREGGRYEFT